MRHGLRLVLALALVATPFFGDKEAGAIADYRVRMLATIELGGVPVESGLLHVVEYHDDVMTREETPGFPSFTLPESMIDGSAASRTATIDIANTGAANFISGPDPAIIVGGTSGLAQFGVVNFTDLGFFLDVTVTGFMEYSGHVEHDGAEWVETTFDLSFAGDVLAGLPADGAITNVRTNTREPTDPPIVGPNGFDLITSTQILGVPENYSVFIPPSVDGASIRVWTIGIFAQVLGNAASRLGGSALLASEIRPSPDGPFVTCEPADLPQGRTLRRPTVSHGVYELNAFDGTDPDPEIYVSDTEGSGPFGPFRSGDLVRLTRTRTSRAGAFVLTTPSALRAHIHLRGNAIITGVDFDGNATSIECEFANPFPVRGRR